MPSNGTQLRCPTLPFCRRPLQRLAAVLAASASLAACAVPSSPLTTAELKAQVDKDLTQIFQVQEPVEGALTVYDAMARVLKYNLDNKLKVMEEVLGQRQVDVASVSLLPRLSASAGYVSRSNINASSSQSITTGRQSLETSTSQEQDRSVGDLGVSWNILDFGVSYVSALQQNDRAIIAGERRRKVIHNIMQDTRQVYWRAVTAERLEAQMGPLLSRIDRALRNSQTISQLRLASPLEALSYQRALLRTRQQLLDLQRELQVAKTQLATLMDLPPASALTLAVPSRGEQVPPKLGLTPKQIEDVALMERPELVEEAYQLRIGDNETTKAMLRMLPGIDLGVSMNFDSNDFLLNKRWADYSAKVVWNLFNLFTGPANVRLAEAQEKFIETRRLALAMAVLTQSRVSWLRYQQSLTDWEIARDVEKIEREIQVRVRNEVTAERRGELEAIQAEFDALLSGLRADLAYAEAQNAVGNIAVTMGFDPLPLSMDALDLKTIASAIRQREQDWIGGKVQTSAADPKLVSPTPAASTPASPAPQPATPQPVAAAPAPATTTVRAGLGTYASEALARESWGALTRKHGQLMGSVQPLLVTSQRQSDGKPFVLLRADGFADRSAAERFCGSVRTREQTCDVLTAAAVSPTQG